MSIDNTLLNREIEKVLNNADGHSGNMVEIKIKAGDKWLIPIRLDYLFLARGYGTGELGDIRTIEVLIGHGDFVHDILPFKDNLLIEYTEIPLKSVGTAMDVEGKIVSKRFRGIVNAEGMQDPGLTNKTAAGTNREVLNQISALPIQIQLIDEIVYKLLMVSTGMTLRKTTTMNALLSVYTRYINLLTGRDDQRIDVIDYREGYNKTVRNQISIPDGTMVKDLHTFLQNREGGIYSTGISRYVQNQVLYIYPLYDTEAYRKNTKILNIINVPNDRFQGSEITYLDEERQLTILATGNAEALDESLSTQLQTGSAIRFANADNIMGASSLNNKNRMLVDRATNITEVAVNSLVAGVNNVRWAVDRLTSNPYKQYSDLARKQGLQLKIEWTRGSADLLLPGMPVKYRTVADDLIKVYYGVLLGVSENRISTGNGMINKRFDGILSLSIFINRMETLTSD